MQVLLDGQPLSIERPSLASALQSAVADAQSRGRIVVEVKGDGVVLSNDDLTTPSEAEGGYARLDMVSADPRVLVRQTVLDAVEALESVRSEQARAMEQVQTGAVGEALNTLQGAFITWQAARDVVARGAALLTVDLESLRVTGVADGVTFATATRDLLAHLAQLKNSLEQQDWSALADIVGYDLDADAQTWHALLVGFAEHVKGLPAGAGVR
ncbi:MAG TPA: hypothetical protein VD997_12385 [Phycisphaerales bacterium]|nr:hypothetical protein [Phycisphaerales bacterium]